jgi:formylglycine-generating enzyme required for sulfatase activity
MMTGKSLGDYTIMKEMGKGTLGTLYLAEHRFLKRPFAIKILLDEIVKDPGFLERFDKEVTSLSSLEHPHIVKVHNISCVDGQYFLATDCIMQAEGAALNLEDYLAKHPGRLKEDHIYQICMQIAQALDYIHSKKVGEESLGHRALKLNNIIVQEKEDGPHVFLSDFGLSRLLGSGWLFQRTCQNLADFMHGYATKGSKKKIDTADVQKAFLQSFSFLAPEQKGWMHHAAYDESKSDVFAFGVIVYYLHFRDYPQGFFEMPSQRFSDLKYNWDFLLSQCLQTSPNKRPSNLVQLMKEIGLDHKSGKEPIGLEQDKEPVVVVPSLQLKLNLKPQEIVRPQFEPDPGSIFQTESVVMRYQPAMQEMKNLDPIMTEMVIIHGGSFFRGSNSGGRDEIPRHQVNLQPFAMDVHPVTNEQFVRFLEVMGGEKDGNNNDMIRLRESRIKRTGGKLSIESGYARHPVVGVTWYGATAYAKWIGKRLPSEAEWESASYGGLEEAIYPTGNNIERSQANFFSSDTTTVMSYPPNNYGIFDMAGNVYEWCNDWYDYHYYNLSVQEPDNPKGPLQGVYRVLRGGCWKSLKEDLRCAHRHRNNPGVMNGTYGFRCVADVVLSG